MTSNEGIGPGDTCLLGVFVFFFSFLFSGPGDTRLLGHFLFLSFISLGPPAIHPHAYECLLVGWFDNYH
jgi:hypothetical protein